MAKKLIKKAAKIVGFSVNDCEIEEREVETSLNI